MFPFPLYFITDPLLHGGRSTQENRPSHFIDPIKGLSATVEEAIDGGARLIQYREKKSTRSQMYEAAKRLREITASHHVTLIINDEIDLALAVHADGVHLGQDDLPLWVARKVLGEKAIVGISTHSLQQAIQAESDGADYIGFGPIFETGTKTSSNRPTGIEQIFEVKRQVKIPLYAIGGIGLSHVAPILAAGAEGVAVISALAGDVRFNVRKWVALLHQTKLDKLK